MSSRINRQLRNALRTLAMFFIAAKCMGGTVDTTHLAYDSSAIVMRQPDQSTQQDVYSDDEWKYVEESEQRSSNDDSFFGRLFGDLLERLFEDSSDSDSKTSGTHVNWWGLFFICVGGGLLVFFIVKATGAGGNVLFKGKSKRKEDVDAAVEDVDIHAIDYDSQIASAKGRNDYRLAVRLWFLRSLKEMSDLRLVEWKIDKTNSDYYYELSGTKLQAEFGTVTLLYDYIWYGDFEINELRYREAEAKLQQYYSDVKLTPPKV